MPALHPSNEVFDAMPRIKHILLGIGLLTLLNCGGDEATTPLDPDLDNAVFTTADHLIVTGLPEFNSTTTTTPVFTWKATGQKLAFLAVFDANIQTRNSVIVNSQANIWSWHSGLGTGREGAIRFEDGRDVVDGNLQVVGPPTPLESGQSYTWAVWAWDNEGKRVTHSSEEMFFVVQ